MTGPRFFLTDGFVVHSEMKLAMVTATQEIRKFADVLP